MTRKTITGPNLPWVYLALKPIKKLFQLSLDNYTGANWIVNQFPPLTAQGSAKLSYGRNKIWAERMSEPRRKQLERVVCLPGNVSLGEGGGSNQLTYRVGELVLKFPNKSTGGLKYPNKGTWHGK